MSSSTVETEVPYTVFSKRRKHVLTVVLTLTMLASPLTATIYLPLLPILATQFDVSIQAINLTITVYLIFQAISPLIFATASDRFGRRPILVSTYALYTLASLGLALNKSNYATLLILRAAQSLGASAVLAIAFGVVADVCPPAKRGSMLGPTQGAANLAVCLGPVIGGLVALRSSGFVWVFWALVIFGTTVWSVVLIGLPETARNVVGNGSYQPSRWHISFWDLFHQKRGHNRALPTAQPSSAGIQDDEMKGESLLQPDSRAATSSLKAKFRKSNPLYALRIMLHKDTALVLWMAASPYAVWYCVQASIPNIYKDVYGFNELQIGLAFLTGGVGTVSGGYANGKLMDWNYKVTAKRIGRSIDKVAGDDLTEFPIERARARGSVLLLLVYAVALTGYGWSVVAKAHEAVPLVLQYVLAALCTSFQQTYNALLVDIYPESPSTASAASNITRCALSAVAVTMLQPLIDTIGRGWFFTALAILSGGGGLLSIWPILFYSMSWRQSRLESTKLIHERQPLEQMSQVTPILSCVRQERSFASKLEYSIIAIAYATVWVLF